MFAHNIVLGAFFSYQILRGTLHFSLRLEKKEITFQCTQTYNLVMLKKILDLSVIKLLLACALFLKGGGVKGEQISFLYEILKFVRSG